jgi:integrase
VIEAHGIKTLAELTVRIPRRRRWWTAIPGLGAAGARTVEAFFAGHPQLTQQARALVPVGAQDDVVPWEKLRVPQEVDGSRGTFRAPKATSTLDADNDYEAASAWLALQESGATQRAYRKEVERLILWAIVQRGRALSSLTTEDAVAYRTFLRHPTPRTRWVGPARPRSSPDWRPFTGDLSARSVAYALSVVGAMFRWLIQQRYLLANPFAGLKVRGASRSSSLANTRVFGEGEWSLIQAVAEGLEWSYGWQTPAAQRLRFVLDFAYATGLRIGELVASTLGQIEVDAQGDRWLHSRGQRNQGRQGGAAAAGAVGPGPLPGAARAAGDTPTLGSANADHRQPRPRGRRRHQRRAPVERHATLLLRRSPMSSRPTARPPRRSCAARARTGCATRTRRTRWRAAPNSPPSATTCGTPRSPRPRSTCTATRSSARARWARPSRRVVADSAAFCLALRILSNPR